MSQKGPLAGFPMIPAFIVLAAVFGALLPAIGPCGAVIAVCIIAAAFDGLYRQR